MRALIAIAAAGVVAALILLHPAAPPPAAALATGWTSAVPAARRAAPAVSAGPLTVYVAGEVARPGVYALPLGARVQDALARAGGLRPGADPVAVNLAEPLRDGEEVAVPPRGAAPVGRARRAATPHPRRSGHALRRRRRVAPPTATVVDLNAADAPALAALPGIGPELASRIVAFRDLNGPFASPDELLDVSGITQHRYDAISPYVTVH